MKIRSPRSKRRLALSVLVGALALAVSTPATAVSAQSSPVVDQQACLPAAAGHTDANAFVCDRMAGPNRYATSKAVMEHPGIPWGTTTVVVVSGENPYDALSATTFANVLKAPILLSPSQGLSPETRAALQAAKARGVTDVVVVGGFSSLSARVSDQISDMGLLLERYYGVDRFDTSAMVAFKTRQYYEEAGQLLKGVFFADGRNFADSLAAGPAAAARNGILLLTNGSSMVYHINDSVLDLDVPMWAIGGNAAKAAAHLNATPVVGTDRFDTAVKVARTFFPSRTRWVAANGDSYPDALSGGALAARLNSPLLLTKAKTVPGVVRTYLNESTDAEGIYLLGGLSSISEPTRRQLCEAAR
ncbi:cell wall-binding repeat-containing protein [Buchananella felis]|uniref:cell wall-binding repeat-containing protein n=1 Tax=Buchananella felis TaxID=3231492 RepID=UPI0035271FBA